jgi:hypothetical protein
MTDQRWQLSFGGVSGLVFAFPGNDPGQARKGLKLVVISFDSRTTAFSLRRLRCFLMVGLISSGTVGESGKTIPEGLGLVCQYDSHYAVV